MSCDLLNYLNEMLRPGRMDAGRLLVVTHLGVIMALLPGQELANTAAVEVSAQDLLTRRQRFDADGPAAVL